MADANLHADPKLGEVAVALTDHRLLVEGFCHKSVPKPEDAEGVSLWPLRHLNFGNEFCARLLPTPAAVSDALAHADAAALNFCLATPMLCQGDMPRVRALLERLPAGTEVVANDWGLVRLLAQEFRQLEPVAGRQLCKMIKDPRLPSSEWRDQVPAGFRSRQFANLLGKMGISRIEIDVPPLATSSDFMAGDPGANDLGANGLRLSVHAPFGFAARGRICKIGGLHLEAKEKFRSDRNCRKECLHYVARLDRGANATADEPATFQRGNALFYRHTEAMKAALDTAVDSGAVERIIYAGDWGDGIDGGTITRRDGA